jgi:hypothetical protein
MSEMQLLLLGLLTEVLQPEKLKARRRLTHNILHYMMDIDKDEEETFNYEKTYLYKEDDKFYYVAIFTKSNIRTIIPCSKRWALTNQIKNQLNLFQNDTQKKQNQQKSSRHYKPVRDKKEVCQK